jgi:AcrR family transcriptional regulator
VTPASAGTARAEQRRATEAAILDAARAAFAEFGYERSTIRRIAEAAGVDPGLVMHYYGSKQQLFALAAQYAAVEVPDGSAQEMADSVLAMLEDRLQAEPVASLAVLRSMLTNDSAAQTYRSAAASRVDQMAATIPAEDAPLRAELITAIIHGVIMQRWMVGPNPLAEAAPEDVVALLRPCLDALITPEGEQAAQPEH